MHRNPLAISTLFALAALLLGGCFGGSEGTADAGGGAGAGGDDALGRITEAGVIRVAFANEEPYGYTDASGRVTGEAPEIVRVIADRLGIAEVELVKTEWKSLIPGLKAGRFDVIGAGMYITPDRAANVAFTDPTYRIGEGFLVASDNPKGLHSYADVKETGARLGVVRGTVERGYARDLGIPDDQVVVFPDNASAVAGIQADRIDAFAGTALTVQTLADKMGADAGVERASPFEQPVIGGKTVYGYGAFAFRPEDSALRDAFNAELATFIGTPEHLALVKPFGFTEAELPQGKTADQVLAEADDDAQ